MRWSYLSVMLLVAACYEQPAASDCTVTCTDHCPGDMSCVHGYCIADGQRCEPAFTSVHAGTGFACALDSQALLWCWGANTNHQIDPGAAESFPRAIQVGRMRWDSIATGGGHVCGIRDGHLFCWGNNDRGQVSDTIAGDATEPLEISVGAPWTFVAAGYNDTCGIAGGTLYCWGAGDSGQLGTGDTNDVGVPTPVATNLADWTSVSTSSARRGGTDIEDVGGTLPGTPWGHTCALSESAGLHCWGAGTNGELGDGSMIDQLQPVAVALPERVTQVAVGAYTTCAISESTQLYCWGLATSHALGDPQVIASEIGTATTVATPILATTLTGWTSIESAEELACALRNDELWCWGTTRGGGGLANGIWGTTDWKQVATGTTAFSLGWNANVDEVGYDHGDLDLGCMLAGGQLSCWGDNRFGQLGQGAAVLATRPTPVAGDHVWSTLEAGASHVCGVEDGRVLCWGSTLRGEANGSVSGTAATPCSPGGVCDIGAPQSLAFVPRADEIDLGFAHACARSGDAITCWGDNEKMQLATTTATSPALVNGAWTRLPDTNGSYGACALQNGQTWCWGAVMAAGAAPARVAELEGLQSFFISGAMDGTLTRSFGCGLDANSSLVCAGDNYRGQFGNGTLTGTACGNAACDAGETATTCPTDCGSGPLTQLRRTYKALSVAWPTDHLYYDGIHYNVTAYACAVTMDGGIECWGRNFRGQMGVDPGVYPHQVTTPNRIAGLESCTAVSSSDYHACAICNGDVYCWGDHRYGAVGSGPRTSVPITAPRKVDLVLDADRWDQLVSGVGFTCGRTRNGAAYCWGFAPHGALGTGATSSPLPVTVQYDY
ncbi:MAG TPA: hypothetical protein VLB44_13985 [Kofleriaceae bacterium]|nr:hypothetical protein [Kofleriaceae bacterium]